ncbi:AraC family transcriptional regulator [Psychrosphaera ytuae]|uniref:AraC family transcriptional regulator n=1 Tax=Psychrosphaera ytuae TaxID=2820710 RepID=A0A975D9H3_9GAMM|nr:AraC family transcriptional regulator [Psychrosphaera ytuae]QTH62808.1 AraC family transcriptional regulator [Psychrosphaera ytuae]
MIINNPIKRQPSVLVENKVTFAAEESELGIYDTYSAATGVALQSDQLLYCGMVSGRKIMHLGDQGSIFLPHESFVLAPDQKVEIDFPDAKINEPTTCIAIEIAKERVQKVADHLNSTTPPEPIFGEWHYRHQAVHAHHTDQTQALLTRIVELYTENAPDRQYLIDLAINELSARLLRQQTRDFIIAYSERDPEANHINAVTRYILDNLTQPLDIECLCRIAVMGRTKFFSAFKRHLGCTPIVFQQQERLKVAARMLEQGHQITETSFSVGFLNVSHFSKSFKSLFGQAPTQYRHHKMMNRRIN